MIATGFLKRSLVDQTGNMSYSAQLSLNNTTGTCTMGLSGTNTINYVFQNSKIYDNSNNLIGAYTPNIPVLISGNVTSTTHDIYINGVPIMYAVPKSTGVINYLYISPLNTTVTINAYAKGSVAAITPSATINSVATTYASGRVITGSFSFSNPSTNFRILSGNIRSSAAPLMNGGIGDNSRWSVSSWTTGDIVGTGYVYVNYTGSGYLMAVSDTLKIRLYTNFNNLDLDFPVSGSEYLNIRAFSRSGIIPAGTTEQLTVTGYRVDGTTEDLSTLAAYGAGNSGLLNIVGSGMASGVSAGATTARAQYDIHVNTISITVA